jgi:hypothetical protein
VSIQIFGSLWYRIRSWIGVFGVYTDNICEHFQQFTHYTGHSKTRCSFLQLLWLLCIWLVWNERNNRLCNNTETSIEQLLDKVKFHSLWWLKAKIKPLFCTVLRIGGRTLYFVWVSTDLPLVYVLCNCLLVGLDPLVHLVLRTFQRRR